MIRCDLRSQVQFRGNYLGRKGKPIPGMHENENQWFHRTFMFRDPSLWKFLIGSEKTKGYIERRFHGLPKRIIMGASSTGHEPVTAVMTLLSRFGEKALENTRFDAFDISSGVVRLARTGLFWVGKRDRDFKKAEQVISPEFLRMHLSMDEPVSDKERMLRLKHYTSVIEKGGLVPEPGKPFTDANALYKASQAVMKKLTFRTHSLDRLEVKPTDSPVLLFFRGALGMFKRDAKVKMLRKLFQKLPGGSSVIVDGYDLVRGADEALVTSGFKPLVPLGDPRRTTPMKIGRVDRYPEILIFEKESKLS